MRDRTRKITLGGKEYTAIFTADALAEVIDTYGDIGKMREKMHDSKKAATKTGIWLIALVVNQGIDYDRYYHGKIVGYITENDVRFLPPLEIVNAQREALMALNDAFAVEDDGEEEDEVLAEIKKPKAAAKK